jgi:hypothetical protein
MYPPVNNKDLFLNFEVVNPWGVVKIKQAKNHVGQPSKFFQNCNFVRYVFVLQF